MTEYALSLQPVQALLQSSRLLRQLPGVCDERSRRIQILIISDPPESAHAGTMYMGKTSEYTGSRACVVSRQ